MGRVPLPLRVALAVAVLIAAGVLLASRLSGNGHEVRASGMIEMDEIDVGSLVGGRVVRLTVDEGDTVRIGDTLTVLEREEVAAEVRLRAAEAERAAAQSREVVTGPRAQEIRMARATLASAEAQADLAARELARAEQLFERGVLSQAELDRARARRNETRALSAAAREQLRLLQAGSRREEIAAARQAAIAARAGESAAASRLSELVLTAPASGVVLLRNFDLGEIAGAGMPVLTLGNPDSLWLRAYVAAPALGRVRLGAPATVRITGDSRRYPGRVAEIATKAEFTPRAALTEEERANIVFAVKIALAPSDGALKAGIPADAVIQAPRP